MTRKSLDLISGVVPRDTVCRRHEMRPLGAVRMHYVLNDIGGIKIPRYPLGECHTIGSRRAAYGWPLLPCDGAGTADQDVPVSQPGA